MAEEEKPIEISPLLSRLEWLPEDCDEMTNTNLQMLAFRAFRNNSVDYYGWRRSLHVAPLQSIREEFLLGNMSALMRVPPLERVIDLMGEGQCILIGYGRDARHGEMHLIFQELSVARQGYVQVQTRFQQEPPAPGPNWECEYSQSHLVQVPPEFAAFEYNGAALNLEWNSLSSWEGIPSTRMLHLGNNFIASFEGSELEQTQELNIDVNQFSEWEELQTVTALRNLSAAGNYFTELPEPTVLPNLYQLNLRGNNITTIEQDPFFQFPHLRILDLRDNPLDQATRARLEEWRQLYRHAGITFDF